ncbi:MAG: hypothetical protein JSV62_07075 [Promethearchaeota archaeon]|nr:MAG: hypothetical protein JSV62_07075 [Candidatus Lokiarchaeota archaeon]
MRHNYKSHGKHCYLRSFPSVCPKCNATVLYWECTHGSKVFFEYPPYGKLIRHYCRHRTGSLYKKNIFPVIVKKPKGLLETKSLSCPICGKLFKSQKDLQNHLDNLKKNDIYHRLFFENKMSFEVRHKHIIPNETNQIKDNNKLKFGKINIKKQKKID